MKNVGGKPETLRTARARATLQAPSNCMALLHSRQTEKGDPIATARIAGILAAKRTDEILPLCHPLPLHHAEVFFEVGDTEVVIEAEAQTIGPTGVEMEALTAATVAALCLYDMLKPYTDQSNLRLGEARLLDKTGGKSHYPRQLAAPLPAVVIDLSHGADGSDAVTKALHLAGFEPVEHESMTGPASALTERIRLLADEGMPSLIVTIGATGVGSNDHAVEAVEASLTKPMPGLVEAARTFRQRYRPDAMLERGSAGMCEGTVVLTLPDGAEAARETLAALMPGLLGFLEKRRQVGATTVL